MDDHQLMLNYQRGDAEAFTELYRRHQSVLLRYLTRQLRQHALAEELFQEVWIKVINASARYQPTAKFTTWLYTIAHNCLCDYWRRNQPESDSSALNDLHHDNSPEYQNERAQQQQHILALVANLPEEQRTCFLLKEQAGLRLEEIAAITQCSTETCKSRLRYAMQKLRAGLEAENV